MKHSLLVLCLAFSSATVEASGIFTLTGVDTTRGANLSYYHNGVTSGGFAGVILGNFNGISANPLFCVDLYTDINYASYNSTQLAPRIIRNEDRVAWLYINQISTVVSQDTGLAFQLAIWDIVHDGGDGLVAGAGLVNISATSISGVTQTQIDLANAYILASQGKSVLTGVAIYQNFDMTTNAPAQNLIGLAVPEPSTILMGAFGVAVLSIARMRRKGSNSEQLCKEPDFLYSPQG